MTKKTGFARFDQKEEYGSRRKARKASKISKFSKKDTKNTSFGYFGILTLGLDGVFDHSGHPGNMVPHAKTGLFSQNPAVWLD